MSGNTSYICCECGIQYAESAEPPQSCFICDDERQPHIGEQTWTTHEVLKQVHRNTVKYIAPDLIGIGIEPKVGIGQRALLTLRPEGNILFECVPLLDETVVRLVNDLGGIQAMSISHPHYYSNMVDWSMTFGDFPIYIHEKDRDWITDPHPNIVFWSEETKAIAPGITMINSGGHFDGATLLHDRNGADGKGWLFTGDIIQVTPDPRMVGFMWSCPLYIPLSAKKVQYIWSLIEPLPFEVVYGSFWPRVIAYDAKEQVRFCAQRHIDALSGQFD